MKKIRLRGQNTSLILMRASFFAIPFNFMPLTGLKKIVGEFYYLGYFYILLMLAGVTAWRLLTGRMPRLSIPRSFFGLVRTWVFCLLISTVINAPDIAAHDFKGRSGLEKIMLQILTFVAVLIFILYYYNLLTDQARLLGREQLFKRFFRTADVLFWFMCGYCLLQYLDMHLMEIPGFHALDDALHGGPEMHGRIRFVSFEVAQFGLFIPILMPFLLLMPRKRKDRIYWIRLILLGVIAALTGSRAALANGLIMVFAALAAAYGRMRRKRVRMLALALFLFALGGGVLLPLALPENMPQISILRSLVTLNAGKYSESNMSRFGMAASVAAMMKANPLGVGLGQFGFLLSRYMRFSGTNYEIECWLDPSDPLWPTSLNFYLRVGAELGILALIAYLLFWLRIFARLARKLRLGISDARIASLGLLLGTGCMTTGFQHDSFTNPALWFAVSLSLFCLQGGMEDAPGECSAARLQRGKAVCPDGGQHPVSDI